MVGDLTRNWWVLVLRGVLAIALGVLAFVKPSITLTTLVIVFGAYALADGVFAIVEATRRQGQRPWWALLLKGIAGIGAGLIAFFLPGITALTLLFLIACWAIASGVLEIATAIRLRKVISGEWLLVLAGIASILFGVTAVLYPSAGALAVLWMIATYAIVFGTLFIFLGMKLRKWYRAGAEPTLRPAG